MTENTNQKEGAERHPGETTPGGRGCAKENAARCLHKLTPAENPRGVKKTDFEKLITCGGVDLMVPLEKHGWLRLFKMIFKHDEDACCPKREFLAAPAKEAHITSIYCCPKARVRGRDRPGKPPGIAGDQKKKKPGLPASREKKTGEGNLRGPSSRKRSKVKQLDAIGGERRR